MGIYQSLEGVPQCSVGCQPHFEKYRCLRSHRVAQRAGYKVVCLLTTMSLLYTLSGRWYLFQKRLLNIESSVAHSLGVATVGCVYNSQTTLNILISNIPPKTLSERLLRECWGHPTHHSLGIMPFVTLRGHFTHNNPVGTSCGSGQGRFRWIWGIRTLFVESLECCVVRAAPPSITFLLRLPGKYFCTTSIEIFQTLHYHLQ